MKKILLITITFIVSITYILGQALPIAMDGKFNDWDNASANYEDSQNDGASYDLLSFSVSNDSTNIYIKFVLGEEIQLNDYNNLYIEIDTDNDPLTGYSINGIGVELAIKFGDKRFYYNPASGGTLYPDPSDINFVALPTVTSDTFEISIGRNVMPDGNHELFIGDTIQLFFADFNSGGDYMPDAGVFEYVFDNSNLEEYQTINFEKENGNDIRLLTYNTLANFDDDIDGLFDPMRQASFRRIIKVLNPDIITFNECWFSSTSDVINLLDGWIPLPNNQHWNCSRINGFNVNGNITCSKYNITDNYVVLPGSRILASIIELPSQARDVIIINSHLKAGGGSSNDEQRQDEADAIINFIKEVKTTGGAITMPYGTPYIISGDLNLVGNSQQLTTLLTGNLSSGESLPPDWDDTNLNDVISYHTDERVAYTWTEENNSYWPGRLDFAICSDIGASISKGFTIHTPTMPALRLAQYGLNANDTDIASDHLPKVTDFIIEGAVQNINTISEVTITSIMPNPSLSGVFTIVNNSNKIINNIDIYNILGQKLISINEINASKYILNLSTFKSGVYYLKIKGDGFKDIEKIIKA